MVHLQRLYRECRKRVWAPKHKIAEFVRKHGINIDSVSTRSNGAVEALLTDAEADRVRAYYAPKPAGPLPPAPARPPIRELPPTTVPTPDAKCIHLTLAMFTDDEIIGAAMTRLLNIMRRPEPAPALPPAAAAELAELRALVEMLTEDAAKLRSEMTACRVVAAPVPVPVPVPVSQPAPRRALPIVAILGCRLEQFRSVVDMCKLNGVDADFRHFDQDQKPRAFLADYAVTMRWVRHSWDDHAKAAVPMAGHRAYITGGTSSAAQQVIQWLLTRPTA